MALGDDGGIYVLGVYAFWLRFLRLLCSVRAGA